MSPVLLTLRATRSIPALGLRAGQLYTAPTDTRQSAPAVLDAILAGIDDGSLVDGAPGHSKARLIAFALSVAGISISDVTPSATGIIPKGGAA